MSTKRRTTYHPLRRARLVSLRAIAVAGLSAIALAASGCSGDSDSGAELSAAFEKRFGEAPWYDHVTEVKMDPENPTTILVVTTDFSGNDSLSETICRAAFDFAVDEVGDEIEAVGMVDSEGKEGGCA